MLYTRMARVNGKIVTEFSKKVDQSKLTSECFYIQIEGKPACARCEFKNKPRLCGGMKMHEKLGVPPSSLILKSN